VAVFGDDQSRIDPGAQKAFAGFSHPGRGFARTENDDPVKGSKIVVLNDSGIFFDGQEMPAKEDLLGEKMMGNNRCYGAVKDLTGQGTESLYHDGEPTSKNTLPCSSPQINRRVMVLDYY